MEEEGNEVEVNFVDGIRIGREWEEYLERILGGRRYEKKMRRGKEREESEQFEDLR